MADIKLNDASFIEWVQLDGELEKLRNQRNKSDSSQRRPRTTNFYKYVIRPLLVVGNCKLFHKLVRDLESAD